MTTTTPTPLNRIRWLPYVNAAEDDAAPAGACLAIVDLTLEDGQAVLQCGQFAGAGPLAFNGLQQVAAGSPGQCTQDYPALAAYDSSATPAPGDIWIPNSGQWSLTKGSAGAANGFLVLGTIDEDAQTMWVVPQGSGANMAIVSPVDTDTEGTAPGIPSSPYGQAVWAGAIVQVVTTAPTFANDTGGDRFSPDPLPQLPFTGEDDPTCFILDLDSLSGSGAPNPTLVYGEFYLGISCGNYTIGDTTLPLYAVRKGCQTDIVQITTNNPPQGGSGSSTAGQTVSPSSNYIFDAQVQNYPPGFTKGSLAAGVNAWLYFVDVPNGSASGAPTAICGDQYVATLMGMYDPSPSGTDSGGTEGDDSVSSPSGDPRPLYFCRSSSSGASIVLGQTNAALGLDAAGTINLYSGTPGSETATGATISAMNYVGYFEESAWVYCAQINGNWYIIGGDFNVAMTATLSYALAATDATATITEPLSMTAAPDPSDSVTPANNQNMSGNSGDEVICLWAHSLETPGWLIVSVTRHSITVVTNVVVGSNDISIDTQKISVMVDGEAGSTTVATGVECGE